MLEQPARSLRVCGPHDPDGRGALRKREPERGRGSRGHSKGDRQNCTQTGIQLLHQIHERRNDIRPGYPAEETAVITQGAHVTADHRACV